MANQSDGKLGKWPTVVPFIASALFLDLIGWWILKTSPQPINNLTGGMICVCVLGGGIISVLPFLLDAKAQLRMTEIDTLAVSTKQISNVQRVVDQITTATAQWMTVQEHSTRSVDSAKAISDSIGAEAKRFSEFMAKANDREKAALKLETEKLRRSETDWLEVLVRVLDHVHALQQAALRSGQKNVMEQLSNFQSACHDAARRVGLMPFIAEPDSEFDAANHIPVEGDREVEAGAKITQTIAMGFTFQGQQIRRAVVALEGSQAADGGTPSPAATEAPEDADETDSQGELL
jgi:molecular chaperone GrpE (heat shock protein)